MDRHKESEKRKWTDKDGNYIGVYETERGGVHMDFVPFFNRPEVIELLDKLRNSDFIKDLRKKNAAKKDYRR